MFTNLQLLDFVQKRYSVTNLTLKKHISPLTTIHFQISKPYYNKNWFNSIDNTNIKRKTKYVFSARISANQDHIFDKPIWGITLLIVESGVMVIAYNKKLNCCLTSPVISDEQDLEVEIDYCYKFLCDFE